ncbi:hypothetical protein GF376_00910 [Candidatus Peregrinibacteria bacterium]|nr:hypothetical protein [Candidatus Peregrinibacteria bacterium]
MKNLLRSGWAKKAILFAFIVGVVSPSALAQVGSGTYTGSGLNATAAVAPQIQNLQISPSGVYDPNDGNLTVSFELNTTAKTSVWIKNSNNQIVRTILFDTDLISGQTYSYSWNGLDTKDNVVTDGTYKAEVVANNSAGTDIDSVNFTVEADNGGGNGDSCDNIISGHFADPVRFDPEDNEDTEINFRLSRDAEVTIRIMDGSDRIETLVDSRDLNDGDHDYRWDGEDDDNDIVEDGLYEYEIKAEVSGCSDDVETGTVRVDTDGSRDEQDDWDDDREGLIRDLEVDPDVIDPDSSDDDENETEITFELTDDVDRLLVQIVDGDEVVYEITDRTNVSDGDYTYFWDGEDEDGDVVDDDEYDVRVMAEDEDNDTDADRVCIAVDTGGAENDCKGTDEDDWPSTDEDLIRDINVFNEIFDPTEGERSRIRFRVTDDLERLVVQVMDGDEVIETLRDSDDVSEGEYEYSWDGRDEDGDIVDDEVYEYRVMADNGDDTDTDRAYTEVDTDGIIIGFPTHARCAGFRDVSIYSPFCKAIELMSAENIFDGYSDGTFRPYKAINRAETTKVVTLALGYDVNTGGFYGKQFVDTLPNAWYAPYLDTALDNGIIHGYPDGTFRPSNTINRVELLKIFLEAHNVGFSRCSTQPYSDTPINADTDWYMPYACYAKQNGLMGGYGNNLFPAQAMTRGDVADLFYDFEQKGAYAGYGPDGIQGGNYRNYDYDYNDNYNNYNDGYYTWRNGRYEYVSY